MNGVLQLKRGKREGERGEGEARAASEREARERGDRGGLERDR